VSEERRISLKILPNSRSCVFYGVPAPKLTAITEDSVGVQVLPAAILLQKKACRVPNEPVYYWVYV